MRTSKAITELVRELDLKAFGVSEQGAEQLYVEMRRIAARHLRRERAGHTLLPTAVVHEAWLRLAENGDRSFRDRNHFFATASLIIRRVLVDHARARAVRLRAERQHEPSRPPTLDPGSDASGLDLVALDGALRELKERDPRAARVVDLRFFGGMTVDEAADVLALSPATVKRDWELARAWLYRQLHAT